MSLQEFTSRLVSICKPKLLPATIPFFNTYYNPSKRLLERARLGTGVFIKIEDRHFILTASHVINELYSNNRNLELSWDSDDHDPIPITATEFILYDSSVLDVAAFPLDDASTTKLLKRHVPISLVDVAQEHQGWNGPFLIVGYPRALTLVREQEWDEESRPAPIIKPFIYLAQRLHDGWKHDKLQYDPRLHLVVRCARESCVFFDGQQAELWDHKGMEGISGCGVWMFPDSSNPNIETWRPEICKMVAIVHSWDDINGRLAGTWVDAALTGIVRRFPELKTAVSLRYASPPNLYFL